jgi:D-alanyl-D-alanine carboxypeptidase
MLSRYAMTLPAYREIARADMWTARGSREIPMYSLVTEARWHIPGADVAKSGYTRSAGRTLVVSAVRDGHRVHAVVMNDPYTEVAAGALIDWAFANFDWGGLAGSSTETDSAEPAASATPSPAPPGEVEAGEEATTEVKALRVVE